jgi:hypothetical protein
MPLVVKEPRLAKSSGGHLQRTPTLYRMPPSRARRLLHSEGPEHADSHFAPIYVLGLSSFLDLVWLGMVDIRSPPSWQMIFRHRREPNSGVPFAVRRDSMRLAPKARAGSYHLEQLPRRLNQSVRGGIFPEIRVRVPFPDTPG